MQRQIAGWSTEEMCPVEEGWHLLGSSFGNCRSAILASQQFGKKNSLLFGCFFRKEKSFCCTETDDVNLTPFCKMKTFYSSPITKNQV